MTHLALEINPPYPSESDHGADESAVDLHCEIPVNRAHCTFQDRDLKGGGGGGGGTFRHALLPFATVRCFWSTGIETITSSLPVLNFWR
jgi:hypothetical protein